MLIACASKFHPMYAEWAIKAGKHVFVEKPHGIDPVGCRRMQAAADLAKTKGLSIVSGMQSRFNTGYQETVKRIHDGEIGDVVAIQAMFCAGRTRSLAAIRSLPRRKTSSTIGITSAGFRATTLPSRWCITLTA